MTWLNANSTYFAIKLFYRYYCQSMHKWFVVSKETPRRLSITPLLRYRHCRSLRATLKEPSLSVVAPIDKLICCSAPLQCLRRNIITANQCKPTQKRRRCLCLCMEFNWIMNKLITALNSLSANRLSVQSSPFRKPKHPWSAFIVYILHIVKVRLGPV